VPERRALICAINDYGDPRNNLPSCLNDANAFKHLLKTYYGFDDANVRELYDSQATMAEVDQGLDWLFSNPSPADHLVFYYSGHGYTRVEDGVLQEMLVLRGEDGGIAFYKDNVLSEKTQDLPAGIFTAVLDSCYSGGMEKAFLDTDKGIYEAARSKVYMPTVAEQRAKALGLQEGGVKAFKPFAAAPTTDATKLFNVLSLEPEVAKQLASAVKAPDDELAEVQMNGLLLSACREDETAAASSSRTEGLSAFTYGLRAIIETLEPAGEAQVEPHSPSEAIHQAVTAKLTTEGFRQRPLLKAPAMPAGLSSRSFITMETVGGVPSQPVSPQPSAGGSWLDALQQMFGVGSKGASVQTSTKGEHMATTTADAKGWFDILPDIIDVGLDIYDTLSKEGLLPEDKAVELPSGVSDQEKEKWLELLPQIFTLGAQVYDTLSKEGMLPEDKAVQVPEDGNLQTILTQPEKWIELIPQIVDLGLDIYDSLTTKGLVAQEKAVVNVHQEAQKWLSLIPIGISLGLEVYNSLTSKGFIAVEGAGKAVTMPTPTTAPSKEADIGKVVKEALGKAGYVTA
jgi:hypothetical protein